MVITLLIEIIPLDTSLTPGHLEKLHFPHAVGQLCGEHVLTDT